MKIRENPLFKTVDLPVALGNYWRELAGYLNNFPNYNHTWTKSQHGAYWAIYSTSGAIGIDLGKSNNFSHLLTENTSLSAPINATPGTAGVIEFKQAASPKTIAFDPFWKWPGGTAGELTAANGAVDVFSYVVSQDGTFATCVMLNDLS